MDNRKRAVAWGMVVSFLMAMVLSFFSVPGFARAEGETEYRSGVYTYTVNADGGAVITKYSGDGRSVVIPEKLDGHPVREIGDMAFSWRKNLTSVTLLEGLTTIGNSAFYDCGSLASVTLPEGLTAIEDYAFSSCRRLASITLPDSLSAIGANPFQGLPTQITISPDHPHFAVLDGVLYDKADRKLVAYPYASKAESFSVPKGIRSIGNSAFSWCGSLASVTLPEGLTAIGDRAFSKCDGLASVTIPASVTVIGDDAFYKCPALTLTVERDSFATSWTKVNGIPYTYPVALDWLKD